jgi:hypothetical protein
MGKGDSVRRTCASRSSGALLRHEPVAAPGLRSDAYVFLRAAASGLQSECGALSAAPSH